VKRRDDKWWREFLDDQVSEQASQLEREALWTDGDHEAYGAALQAERRERGKRHRQFVDGLVKDFNIPDRRALEEILRVAEQEYERERLFGKLGEETQTEAWMLDELDLPLRKTLWLLGWLKLTLAQQMAGVGDEEFTERYAEVSRKEDELRDLEDRLADVARAAAKVSRHRRGRGEHHSEHKVVRGIVDVLVDYWKHGLGRKFGQDHKTWTEDRGRLVPKSKAVRFVFRVVEHLAPGRGATLKTIAREFTGDGK
jgi:hypothetical protein